MAHLAGRCFHVVAFSGEFSRGNPAAVVFLSGPLPSPAHYLAISAEFNLSETAFVELHGVDVAAPGANAMGLRWFTPRCEVDLCGHATLAAAHALYTCFGASALGPRVTFSTRSGPLVVSLDAESSQPRYAMKFPYNAPRSLDVDALPGPIQNIVDLVLALPVTDGAPPVRLRPRAVAHNARTKKLIVELCERDCAALYSIAPNNEALFAVDQSSLPQGDRVTGVSVAVASELAPNDLSAAPLPTAPSAGGFDFMSRYFTPWNGIPEDPVNGSSHTILGPYFAHRLAKFAPGASSSDGKHFEAHLRAVQASRRSGTLGLHVEEVRAIVSPGEGGAAGGAPLPAAAANGNTLIEGLCSVTIYGEACIVVEGTLLLGV